MIKLRRNKVGLVGLMYIGVGLAFSIAAIGYPLGTTSNVGPGLFPLALAFLLIIVGLISLVSSNGQELHSAENVSWDQPAHIFGSICLFAVLLEPMGLVIAVSSLVVVASRASNEVSLRTSIGLAIALSGICTVIFVLLLGLPLPVWPSILNF